MSNTATISVGAAGSALGDFVRRVDEECDEHPFATLLDSENFDSAIAEYLAMSVSFPYIQAGALYRNYNNNLRRGDIEDNAEITAAVGSFLVWDELGAVRLNEYGNSSARRSLSANIHSKLLRSDLQRLLGRSVAPHWSEATQRYLDALLEGLSDPMDNRNVAYMVAFEHHAQRMIDALWSAISRIFGNEKAATLDYFCLHVGGDSPAEAAHVEMTEHMISELVGQEARNSFVEQAMVAYLKNVSWCSAIL